MARMYDLTAQWAALVDAYEAAEDADERAEALEALEGIEADMSDKADAIARIVRNYRAEVEGLKAEEQRLAMKRRNRENAIERLQHVMLDAMQATGAEKVQTSIGAWRVQANPWSCEVTDEAAVPEEWHIKVEDRIDKRGLVEHFKATGEMVDGVEYRQTMGVRFR